MFEVGQVVYLLEGKRLAIVPLMIEEQITKRTRAGELISYIVSRLDNGEEAEIADTSNVYATVIELRTKMIENAEKAIDRLIADAQILVDASRKTEDRT
jgi:hypothetical protein